MGFSTSEVSLETLSPISKVFARARQENRAALIPYLTGGYPDPSRFVQLALQILESGADALEIGVPFSDPLLDGPSIQVSQQIALENGTGVAGCLGLSREIRDLREEPLLLMGAYNPILSYGQERFCEEARQSGVSALIIPDLPIEEQLEMSSAAGMNDLDLIQLVAPTTSPERLTTICRNASGFIYCISVAGVTGARSDVSETARPLVEKVRACTQHPVAVGFGIARPDQARLVSSFADGIIVGSALVNVIAGANEDTERDAVAGFIRALRDAVEH